MQPPQGGSAGAQDETIVVEEHFIAYAFRPGLSIGGSKSNFSNSCGDRDREALDSSWTCSCPTTSRTSTVRRDAGRRNGWESLCGSHFSPKSERRNRAASAALGRELQDSSPSITCFLPSVRCSQRWRFGTSLRGAMLVRLGFPECAPRDLGIAFTRERAVGRPAPPTTAEQFLRRAFQQWTEFWSASESYTSALQENSDNRRERA